MCLGALVHTYFIYPMLISILHGIKGSHKKDKSIDKPNVSILMAVYNEQDVIRQKINSILNSSFPPNNIELLIGSDGSTDNTDEYVKEVAKIHPQIKLYSFEGRNGKPKIIDSLKDRAKNDIIIVTDANVLFDINTIGKLTRHFSNAEIGLVDSRMTNTGIKKEGISIQEKNYINLEGQLKYYEGALWGCLMGPFGGCYAIRKDLMPKVPTNFTVDDFFICMSVIDQGYKTIGEPEAIVYEDVSNILKEEFRRKTRIATGNFQNLFYFKHLIVHFNKAYSYCFFSHKVLRWLGPVFLIGSFISNILLIEEHSIFFYTILGQVLFYFLALFDLFLKKFEIHSVALRYITHFVAMNVALLVGMFLFIKGVKSNVWEPTKRFQ